MKRSESEKIFLVLTDAKYIFTWRFAPKSCDGRPLLVRALVRTIFSRKAGLLMRFYAALADTWLLLLTLSKSSSSSSKSYQNRTSSFSSYVSSWPLWTARFVVTSIMAARSQTLPFIVGSAADSNEGRVQTSPVKSERSLYTKLVVIQSSNEVDWTWGQGQLSIRTCSKLSSL